MRLQLGRTDGGGAVGSKERPEGSGKQVNKTMIQEVFDGEESSEADGEDQQEQGACAGLRDGK
jgi:hypothetical protein